MCVVNEGARLSIVHTDMRVHAMFYVAEEGESLSVYARARVHACCIHLTDKKHG